MQYLALLISKERDLTPEQGATEMAAYQSFHAKAGSAIRAGDALLPPATGARITGGPDAPTVTDGPFAEGAEIAGGYYVFEAENLDDALALARDIPAAQYGAVEVRPIFHTMDSEWSRSDATWLALLLEPPAAVEHPGHTGVGGGSGAARRIRRCGGRSHRRGCGTTRAGDGDHGAGPRRPGVAHRRAVRGSRRDRHGRLSAGRRRPRRGGQAGRR